jgi:hypothetical protein
MSELWDGLDSWSEEHEQAFVDRWALRILTCPKRRCRRQRLCAMDQKGQRAACPGYRTVPDPEDEAHRLLRLTRHALIRSIAEDESDDPALPAIKAVRVAAARRRDVLAYARAKKAVLERRGLVSD